MGVLAPCLRSRPARSVPPVVPASACSRGTRDSTLIAITAEENRFAVEAHPAVAIAAGAGESVTLATPGTQRKSERREVVRADAPDGTAQAMKAAPWPRPTVAWRKSGRGSEPVPNTLGPYGPATSASRPQRTARRPAVRIAQGKFGPERGRRAEQADLCSQVRPLSCGHPSACQRAIRRRWWLDRGRWWRCRRLAGGHRLVAAWWW